MRFRLLLPMLVGLLVITGCGKAGALLMPDPRPRVPREFDLPSGKIAILIDDHLANLPREEMKIQIADEITDLLKSQARLKRRSFLPYDDVLGVDSEKAQGGLNSIQYIGRQVGADIVIYINVTEFELQADPDSPPGHARSQGAGEGDRGLHRRAALAYRYGGPPRPGPGPARGRRTRRSNPRQVERKTL